MNPYGVAFVAIQADTLVNTPAMPMPSWYAQIGGFFMPGETGYD
jgi:hypothetical protein